LAWNLRVANLVHGLQRIVVAVAFVGDQPGCTLGFGGAEVCGLDDRPQRPFGGHRMLGDEVLVRRHNAAEVLRPGTVEPPCAASISINSEHSSK